MKIIIAIAFIFAILVPDTSAQSSGVSTELRMFPVKDYASTFISNVSGNIAGKYTRMAAPECRSRVAALGNDLGLIDSYIEIAGLSGCAGVVNERPVEAVKMLETPRQVDMMNYAWLLQEIAVLRFLGNTRAVGVHEGELKIITDRGNVTRQQAVAFYEGPNGIRALVSQAVENEFNKISFRLDYHQATLTRNPQTGQYILSYGGINTNGETRTVTGNLLEALSSEMRDGKNKADFTPTDRAIVRTQSALIPSVVFAERKAQGLGDGVALAKEALTNFYLKPSDDTYLAVYGIRLRLGALRGIDEDVFAEIAMRSYNDIVRGLSPELLSKFENERRFTVLDAARIPNDPRYNVFSTRQPSGGR